jgi:hypothetical protein
MRACIRLTVLALIVYGNSTFPQAQDAQAANDISKIEVGISFEGADAGPHKIGEMVAGNLLISYKNVPSGVSLYLAVHPLRGNALVTPEGATIAPIELNLNLTATLQTDSDGGVFQIGRANYPAELLIPTSKLEALASKVWDSESVKAISAAFGPQGLRLVLGFLASLGRGGDGHEQAYFSFMLPKLEHPYDSVLITPMLLSYETNGEQRILFRSGQMHSLKLSVTSN